MAVVAAVVTVAVALYSMSRTVNVPGTKLGDLAQQTAKEGEPRLIVYGIVRPVGGNLVAVQEPPRIERRKQKSGGKGGGGGSSSTIEVPRRTYAIGICEGPVTGIRRVWRNNKLVYDGRGTDWGARNNGTFLNRFRFYLGDWDQMPDPSLESIFGVGTVPAMRGTCYMVARDEDLQDTGGAVPQWIFEVARAYGYGLTSKPYPAEGIEALDVGLDISAIENRPLVENINEINALDLGLSVNSLVLASVVPPEYLEVQAIDVLASVTALALAPRPVPEASASDGFDVSAELTALLLRVVVLSYTLEDEAVDVSASVLSIELTGA